MSLHWPNMSEFFAEPVWRCAFCLSIILGIYAAHKWDVGIWQCSWNILVKCHIYFHHRLFICHAGMLFSFCCFWQHWDVLLLSCSILNSSLRVGFWNSGCMSVHTANYWFCLTANAWFHALWKTATFAHINVL